MFSIRAIEPDVTNARRVVAEQSAQLRNALENTNVPKEEVGTERFQVRHQHPDPQGRRSEKSDPDEIRYEATEHIGVTLHDLDSLGSVLSAAVDDASAEIVTVAFTFRTETKRALQQDALSDAVVTARKKAEAAAAAEGLELGDVRSMTTGEGQRHQRAGGGQALASTTESGSAPASGPIDVHARVDVEYELCER